MRLRGLYFRVDRVFTADIGLNGQKLIIEIDLEEILSHMILVHDKKHIDV
jgi:hypothetical protein